MKGSFNNKRLTKSANSPIKLTSTTKTGSKLNIKVQLISSKTVKSPTKHPTKIEEPNTKLQELSIFSTKVLISNQQSLRNPDDFIEPLPDLSIPSTETFYQHKKLLSHIPAIVDCEGNKKPKQKEQNSLIKDYKLASCNKASKNLRVKKTSKSLDIDNFNSLGLKTWTLKPKLYLKKQVKNNN